MTKLEEIMYALRDKMATLLIKLNDLKKEYKGDE